MEVRYDPNNNLVDNFTYSYYTVIGNPSNRLKSIGSGSDYTYDPSGNVSFDDLNKNLEFVYDWRNLMIENKNVSSLFTFRTFYKYDDAGNRINKKQYMWVNGIPPGGIEDNVGGTDSLFLTEGDGSGYWAMTANIFYVRDVAGKEIAVYKSAVV